MYIMVLLFAIPLIAQEKNNTITVIGETEKTVVGNTYTILVSLQQVTEGYHGAELMSLSKVKATYTHKLGDLGIDFSRFRRNTLYEFSVSFSEKRETAYYYFKTTNKEDVRKITKLNLSGVSIINVEILPKKLTNEELAKLSNEAIEDARQTANATAKKMSKTIGDILTVVDSNTKTQYINSYGTTPSQLHTVTVVFELKQKV